MQRWMVVSVVIAVVLVFGAGAGYVLMKLNQPDPRWMPLLLNPELPEEKREEVAAELRTMILERERLLKMVREEDVVKGLGFSSEEEAVLELERRIFIKVGEAATEMGYVPALHIGVSGKRKERSEVEKLAMRVMKEVQAVIDAASPPQDPDDGI